MITILYEKKHPLITVQALISSKKHCSRVAFSGPDYNPDGLGSRFLLWTLFVAMFMINASYSAVLTSYLTVKNEQAPINNFEQFLRDGGYTLGIQNNTVYMEELQVSKR